jgi:hypothetical protein
VAPRRFPRYPPVEPGEGGSDARRRCTARVALSPHPFADRSCRSGTAG